MNLKVLTCERSFGKTQDSNKQAGHSCCHPLNLRSLSGKSVESVVQEGFEALAENGIFKDPRRSDATPTLKCTCL